MKNQANVQNVSRRKFIAAVGLATAATGGVIASGAVALAAKPKEAATIPKAGDWPWVQLDPQEAAERAFKDYHAKGG